MRPTCVNILIGRSDAHNVSSSGFPPILPLLPSHKQPGPTYDEMPLPALANRYEHVHVRTYLYVISRGQTLTRGEKESGQLT